MSEVKPADKVPDPAPKSAGQTSGQNPVTPPAIPVDLPRAEAEPVPVKIRPKLVVMD